jgi:hypothetical protein
MPTPLPERDPESRAQLDLLAQNMVAQAGVPKHAPAALDQISNAIVRFYKGER